MPSLGELIYTVERAPGEVAGKVESHVPKIDAPSEVAENESFTVEVRVGPHPNSAEHSIRKIELYFQEEGRKFNPIRLATVELEPGYAEPILRIQLRLSASGTLHALAYCNLHGLWESRHFIKVFKRG